MIRVILVALFMLIVFIVSLIMLPLEWLIGKININAKDISSLRMVQGIFKVVLFISGTKTTIIGKENIPTNESVLFVGNHRGNFDTVIAYSIMPNITGFIAKKEMNKVPIIRVWMRYLYDSLLDRQNPKEGLKTILKGIEYLKNGKSIVIFPEGTRNDGDGVLKFHGGSFKLAEKSNCKIIPMVQNNTENILETHMPFIKRTQTIIEFGKPIDVALMSKEERRNLPDITYNIVKDIYEHNKCLINKSNAL